METLGFTNYVEKEDTNHLLSRHHDLWTLESGPTGKLQIDETP